MQTVSAKCPPPTKMLARNVLLLASLVGLCAAKLPCGKPAPTAARALKARMSAPFKRVVGGTDAIAHKLPWVVALTEPRVGIPFCSGVLVSPQYVLTSASCAELKDSYNLVLNENNWEMINRIIRRDPAEVTVHPSYSGGEDYNVALVKLSDEPVMSVPTICMPKKKTKIFNRKSTVVAGWGATEKEGMASPGLQQLKVKLMKKCVDDSVNTDVTLCSLNADEGGKGLCSGDTGSPVMDYKKKKHTLVGIASSSGCGEVGALDYYTNVKAPEIKEWMDSIITA